MSSPLSRQQWAALPARQRRLVYARLTEDERADLRALFTATTPGDNLRYPNDYNAPADSPAAFRDLANDTQTALNRRMTNALTSANISRASGWGNAFPTVNKTGNLDVLSGIFQRSATLAFTANTGYTIGTLPTGHRPAVVERCACAWSDGGVRHVGQIWLMGDGSVDWYPTASGTLAVDDWVSVSGITYVTAGA